MQKVEFIVKQKQELIKAIIDELPFLSRYDVKKILDNKDVKVNNCLDNMQFGGFAKCLPRAEASIFHLSYPRRSLSEKVRLP